jgi:hypothetical protein
MGCAAFGGIGTAAWLAFYSTGGWKLRLEVVGGGGGGTDIVAADAVGVVRVEALLGI